MAESATLNRFPLFGLFCHRAALRMGKSESQAELLGYSMAVLYAIFKSQTQRRREAKAKKERRELPPEVKKATTDTVNFGGHDFMVVKDDAGHIRQTVVGHETHSPGDFGKRVQAKFSNDRYERFAERFDRYLQSYEPSELTQVRQSELFLSKRQSIG